MSFHPVETTPSLVTLFTSCCILQADWCAVWQNRGTRHGGHRWGAYSWIVILVMDGSWGICTGWSRLLFWRRVQIDHVTDSHYGEFQGEMAHPHLGPPLMPGKLVKEEGSLSVSLSLCLSLFSLSPSLSASLCMRVQFVKMPTDISLMLWCLMYCTSFCRWRWPMMYSSSSPIMAAIMVAKWVGDFITHPLYHALLELKCIPFLDAEPVIVNEAKKV